MSVLLQSLAVGLAHAGAWTLPKNTGLAIVTGLVARADRSFGDGRSSGRIPKFRKAEVQVLAEYGLSDRFTVRGQTEFQSLRFEKGEPRRMDGLGFSEIGGRYRVFERGGLVASAEGNLRIAEAREGVDPLLDGLLEPEYEARLLGGYGLTLADMPTFVDLQAAYRLRAGMRADEVKIDATLGVRPWPKVLALAQLFSTFGIETDAVPSFDQHKLQVSGVYDLTSSLAVQFGGYGTIAGRNALAEHGLVSAVWVRF